MQSPQFLSAGVQHSLIVKIPQLTGDTLIAVRIDDQPVQYESISDSTIRVQSFFSVAGEHSIALVYQNGKQLVSDVFVYPGWTVLLPSIVAIALALVYRQVIFSLFIGVWFGVWILSGLSLSALAQSFFDVVSIHVVRALIPADGDTSHVMIVLFTLIIGGFVGVIAQNGGAAGLVEMFKKFARTSRSGQFVTYILGLLFFFDDYANALVVGNVMRPITDRLKVSREKLAYIVDSTSAPVASLMFVSTWIGFEVGLIQEAIDSIGELALSGYEVFIYSLPYRFYPVFALVVVFLSILSRREIGPMYTAELHAHQQDRTRILFAGEINEQERKIALNALIPLAVLLFVLFWGLIVTGEGETIAEIIASSNSYVAMLWASIAGSVAAIFLGILTRVQTVSTALESWIEGVRTMMIAVVILVLAWTLSLVNEHLHVAEYLANLLKAEMSPIFLPAIVFLVCAVASFATGTSWGVMAIFLPLVIPLTWSILSYAHLINTDVGWTIFYATVSSILAGAVWGDHCSPISDTTILSSMASGCDHIEHVRTQFPYALIAGIVAIFGALIPIGFGIPLWVVYLSSLLLLFGCFRFLGRKVEP